MVNHFLAIINTCPYMPTSLSNFVRLAVDLGPEDDLTVESEHGVGVGVSPEKSRVGQETGVTSSSSAPSSSSASNDPLSQRQLQQSEGEKIILLISLLSVFSFVIKP